MTPATMALAMAIRADVGDGFNGSSPLQFFWKGRYRLDRGLPSSRQRDHW
jgi:hypothetical protein